MAVGGEYLVGKLLEAYRLIESLRANQTILNETVSNLKKRIEEIDAKTKSVPRFKLTDDERGEELKAKKHKPMRVNGEAIRAQLREKHGDISTI